MSKSVPVDDSNFDQMVLQSRTPVLVDLWAAWCRPCLMVAPILDELAEEYNGRISFVKVDVDQNGKIRHKHIGYMNKDTLKNYFLKLVEEE